MSKEQTKLDEKNSKEKKENIGEKKSKKRKLEENDSTKITEYNVDNELAEAFNMKEITLGPVDGAEVAAAAFVKGTRKRKSLIDRGNIIKEGNLSHTYTNTLSHL